MAAMDEDLQQRSYKWEQKTLKYGSSIGERNKAWSNRCFRRNRYFQRTTGLLDATDVNVIFSTLCFPLHALEWSIGLKIKHFSRDWLYIMKRNAKQIKYLRDRKKKCIASNKNLKQYVEIIFSEKNTNFLNTIKHNFLLNNFLKKNGKSIKYKI